MLLDNGTAHFLRPADSPGLGDPPPPREYLQTMYGKRTVGMYRFYEARQAGTRVDRMIRILHPTEDRMVWADDICTLGDAPQQYRVVQAQEVTDEESGEEVLDISLERMAGIWQ